MALKPAVMQRIDEDDGAGDEDTQRGPGYGPERGPQDDVDEGDDDDDDEPFNFRLNVNQFGPDESDGSDSDDSGDDSDDESDEDDA